MFRLLTCVWGLCTLCIVVVALGEDCLSPPFAVSCAEVAPPTDQQTPQAGASTKAQQGLCLKKTLHWSERPPFGPGVFVILTRLIEFETAEGKTYQAKAFLVEILPQQAQWPADVPPEVQAKRRTAPARMLCLGFQIEADEHFQPDYVVPKQYVTKRREPCMYRVSLGTVDCDVRVVSETPDRQE